MRAMHPLRQNRFRATGVIVALMAIVGACADSPETRYGDAVLAGKNAEDLEDYLLFFTTASAEMLRGTQRVTKSKNNDFAYLQDVRTILPEKDVEEVEERGNLALVKLDGLDWKPIRMIREKGEWAIDAFSLPTFWAPLRKEAEN